MVSDTRPIKLNDAYSIVRNVYDDLSNLDNLHKLNETDDLVGFCESLAKDLGPALEFLKPTSSE